MRVLKTEQLMSHYWGLKKFKLINNLKGVFVECFTVDSTKWGIILKDGDFVALKTGVIPHIL